MYTRHGSARRLAIWLVLSPLAGLAFPGCGGGSGSSPSTGGQRGAPSLLLTVTPATVTVAVFPYTTFIVSVNASESGTTATPTITLRALPAGVTTSSTFPMSVPSNGANIVFTTSWTIVPGTFNIAISGAAGTATTT